jgi:hypothetical protein
VDNASLTEKKLGWLAPFIASGTSSSNIIGRWSVLNHLHWMTHVQAVLVPQDTIIFDYKFFSKVLQPLSVLKDVERTDKCSGTIGRILFAVDHQGWLLSSL